MKHYTGIHFIYTKDTLSAFSSAGFPDPEGKDMMETFGLGLSVLRSLTFCIMSDCEYLFPSAVGGSFSDDG